jgi:hypothetical protein
MDTKEICEKLIDAGEKMRNLQKGYFKERDPVNKKSY